jgi:hypothetical protein
LSIAFDSTRFAIAIREVAATQLSPLVGQSVFELQVLPLIRHIFIETGVALVTVKLHVPPVPSPMQLFEVDPLQTLSETLHVCDTDWQLFVLHVPPVPSVLL